MNLLDKALNHLLDLGNPTLRRDRAEQLDQALRTMLALTEGDAAVIVLPGRTERLVLHRGSAAPSLAPAHPDGSEVVRTFGQDAHPIALGDLTDEARFATHDAYPGVEGGPALFAALRRRGQEPGHLGVYRRRGRAKFSPADVRAIVLLATTLQHSLEALRLSRGLEKLAFTDDLTEVYNARFVKSALEREVRRAARFGHELGLLIISADRFQSLEQKGGAAIRETRIKELAKLLVQQVRSFDFVARYGSGSFLTVLPQTGRSGALEVAERIRAAVEAHAFFKAEPGTLTVSIGLSAFPQEGSTPRILLTTVERSLGAAQNGGGNRVGAAEKAA
jgi:diguanylate cyclase (GGDEF)-like protein